MQDGECEWKCPLIAVVFVSLQPDDERNYHVFYEMLSAMSPEEKKGYGLQDAPQYFYLNQVNRFIT